MPASTFYRSNPVYEKVINKLERPLVNIFALTDKWLPEPTKENTNKHNCHVLIEIRDALMGRWFKDRTALRARAIRAMFNFIISKYDRDNVNGGYLDDVLKEWSGKRWVFRDENPETNKKRIAELLDEKKFDEVMDLIQ
jgi:hypothetical protein